MCGRLPRLKSQFERRELKENASGWRGDKRKAADYLHCIGNRRGATEAVWVVCYYSQVLRRGRS